jgi:putative transposase
MRKSRFTEPQIIGMIKEQQAGLPTAELCRKHGLSPTTFDKLKAKYGGIDLCGVGSGIGVLVPCWSGRAW